MPVADIGSATGDHRLATLKEQVPQRLLSSQRTEPCSEVIEGHALHYLHFLPLAGERTDLLADRPVHWAIGWRTGKTLSSFSQGLSHYAGFIGTHSSSRPAQTAVGQLADAAFQAEHKYHNPCRPEKGNDSLVNWGGPYRACGNIFFTLDALGSLPDARERF